MKCKNGCDDNYVFDEKYAEYICCECGENPIPEEDDA